MTPLKFSDELWQAVIKYLREPRVYSVLLHAADFPSHAEYEEFKQDATPDLLLKEIQIYHESNKCLVIYKRNTTLNAHSEQVKMCFEVDEKE